MKALLLSLGAVVFCALILTSSASAGTFVECQAAYDQYQTCLKTDTEQNCHNEYAGIIGQKCNFVPGMFRSSMAPHCELLKEVCVRFPFLVGCHASLQRCKVTRL